MRESDRASERAINRARETQGSEGRGSREWNHWNGWSGGVVREWVGWSETEGWNGRKQESEQG